MNEILGYHDNMTPELEAKYLAITLAEKAYWQNILLDSGRTGIKRSKQLKPGELYLKITTPEERLLLAENLTSQSLKNIRPPYLNDGPKSFEELIREARTKS